MSARSIQLSTNPTSISARFIELSTIHGSPAAAARALKFPINSYVRVSSGLPVRPGTTALAKQCLAEYDAAGVPVAPPNMAISSLPPAGEIASL